MNEYDVQDPYGTYDVGDELKPYEILNQMKSWDKEIRLTVSAVQLGLEGATQQQSQILLDIDSIELSVVDIGGRLGTAESTIELHAGQIALKATQAQVDGVNARVTSAELLIDGLEAEILLRADASTVDAIGSRVTSAELEIDGLNAEILLKVNSSVTDGLNTRLGTAEVFIDGVDARIALKADSAFTNGLNTRLGSAELEIDGLGAEILLKASSASVTQLTTDVGNFQGELGSLGIDVDTLSGSVNAVIERMTSAELDIDGLNASILLKAEGTTVTTLTGRVDNLFNEYDGMMLDLNDVITRTSSAEIAIDGLQGEIALKASTSVVNSLGTRTTTVEQNLSSLDGQISQKVSQTDYNGNTIMTMFNQSATTIKMLAQNIDLAGIVRVADSIELGLSSNGATKAIKFNGTNAWIYSDASNLNIDTSFLHLKAYTSFWQGVDFRNQPIINHPFSLSGHNHDNVYQAKGNYSVSGHDHGFAYVKPQTGQQLALWHNGSTTGRIYNYDSRQYFSFTTTSGVSF